MPEPATEAEPLTAPAQLLDRGSDVSLITPENIGQVLIPPITPTVAPKPDIIREPISEQPVGLVPQILQWFFPPKVAVSEPTAVPIQIEIK